MGVRRRGKLRVETVLNSSAEPIFLLNPDREVVFFNGACEQLTGRSAAQVVGLACQYRGSAGSKDLPDLGASLAPPPEVFQGEPATIQSLFIRPDGQRLWRHIQFFPCHDDSRRVLAIMGLVSERANSPAEATSPHIELHTELLRLRDRLHRRYGFDKIVCASPAMRRVLDQVRVASQTDATVLIWGEAGTGKELVARTIHHESARKAAPCVPIECAVVPPDALERDLFGNDPAREWELSGGRPGLLRHAHGGTLILKNLSRLSRDIQSRLADMLRDARPGELIHATGDRISLRLIASDRIDPAGLAAGELRPDLYFALSTLVIHIPPLRERKSDLPLLTQMCVESVNAAGQKQVAGLSTVVAVPT
ncbi:MAG: sigma 54-interacting transcriptional regulator [Planctomycetes bacterium]|nr:sigma 54-interacting transcriptional regulator [Planctomycetota bacterium]